jgi:hypothetical protein
MVGVVQRPTIVGQLPFSGPWRGGWWPAQGGRSDPWMGERKGEMEEGERRDPASGSGTAAAAGGQQRGGSLGGVEGKAATVAFFFSATSLPSSARWRRRAASWRGVAGVGGSWVGGEGEEDLLDGGGGAVGGVGGGVVVVLLAGDTCGSRRRGRVAVLAGRGAGGWAALAGAVRVGARSAGGPDAGTGGRVC